MLKSVKDYIEYWPDGRVKWPTLCACTVCGGITGIANQNISKDLAYEIALMQHGYYLKDWEGHNVANANIYPYKCTCECKHEWNEIKRQGSLSTYQCKYCGIMVKQDSSD
ncbi:MAG: hypothetical protein WC067_05430 [Candidatus Methanomethylophilaceae archaeon]